MLTRNALVQRFAARALFGMVHLRALPGAPLFGGSMDAVIEAALADGRALAAGGADGLVIENFGDRPFVKNRVPPETIASMARVVSEIAREVRLPFGVNVLRNDAQAALAIAAATGAAFIRVNVHAGAVVADQGVIEGEAAETMRRRATSACARSPTPSSSAGSRRGRRPTRRACGGCARPCRTCRSSSVAD